jgi:transcriptional regulator with GAF, ATPase, and Fis domain
MATERVDPPVFLPRDLRLPAFSIKVTEGPDAGTSFQLGVSEVHVGTLQGNHVVLTDPTVSRCHLTITVTPDGNFRLRDHDSSNGSLVGNVRLKEGYVKGGAQVRIGKTILSIDLLTGGEGIREDLSQEDRFGAVLGTSVPMRRIFAALPKIAQSSSTVLIEGETGTGKGLLAQAIHEASPRSGGPFVVLDCAALPPTLIEDELFGHVKGAFTGAISERAGHFEQASGGTIFIDEIGELPLDMQPKLLRVLEERTVQRVGGINRKKIDVRVIAATNRDLRTEVNRGAFRSDLFYRLNVVRIHIPPLRKRPGDVDHLARHFYSQRNAGQTIPSDLLNALRVQSWPGNVRELSAAVECATLPKIDNEQDQDATPSADVSFCDAKQQAEEQWEEQYVRELYARAGGNLSLAARLVRMDRSHLRKMLHKYGVKARE